MNDAPIANERGSTQPAVAEAAKEERRLAELAANLSKGSALEFTDSDAPQARLLPARWLAQLLSNKQSSDAPVVISGATIKGKLELRHANLKVDLYLLNSTFDGGIDCSFATFERQADFTGSHFLAPVEFCEATFKRDLALTCARFSQKAALIFDDARVEGILHAEGARFAAANFKRCRLASAAFFGPSVHRGRPSPTSFSGDADFTDARIEGPLYFDCVQFGGAARFRRARIDSAVYFRAYTDAWEAQHKEPPSPVEESPGPNEESSGHSIKPPPCLPELTLSPHEVSPPDLRVAAEPLAVCFGGDADFNHAEIHGVASFEGAKFCKKLDFVRAQVKNSIVFNTYVHPLTNKIFRAVFHDKVDFTAAQVAGGASFMGTQFWKHASFERINIGGNLLFKASVVGGQIIITEFEAKAKVTFLGAYVRHNAEFDGACFTGKAIFERLEVGNNAFFRPAYDDQRSPLEYKRCIFNEVADFLGMHIIGSAEFPGAHFKQEARFEGFHVEGNTFFNDRFEFPGDKRPVPPVQFDGKADFTSAHFAQRVKFYTAHFGGEATFNSATFDGAAIFTSARFSAKADFTSANANGSVFFIQASFGGETCFRAARFKSLDFNIHNVAHDSPPGTNFGDALDLLGFTYDLININVSILVPMLDSMQIYNRQPYTQLEKVLRQTGQDELADKTYLTQRARERKQKKEDAKKRWKRWYGAKSTEALSLWPWMRNQTSLIFDTAQKYIGNYGVQPFLRLFLISCGVVIFGMLVFRGNGAVVPREGGDKKFIALKEEPDGRRVVRTIEPEDKLSSPAPPVQLGLTQAFAVSLNQFIPIVQIPSGSKWKPSEKILPVFCCVDQKEFFLSYAFYATIHSLLGVILVPLGVAALTGVLHRQEKPGK